MEEIDINRVAELGNDILPMLDRLRAADPIHWNETNQCWMVTAHRHVVDGFSGRLPLTTAGPSRIGALWTDDAERERDIGDLLRITGRFLTFLEPGEHLKIRKLLMKAFSNRSAERYRPFTRAAVAGALARVSGSGDVEVMALARAVTARTILEVMGLPHSFLDRLEDWSTALNEGLTGTTDKSRIRAADRALADMEAALLPEIRARRIRPSDDFISWLIEAEEDGDRLGEQDIVSQIILTLIAGHDTTMNTLTLAIATLAEAPAERDFIRDNPGKIIRCIEELMRVVAMSTSMVRTAAEGFRWEGRDIRRGDIVFLVIAAANRDPDMFDDPLQLNFERPQQLTMTFAPGQHFCIGHWFAKMMMSEFLPAFLERYESWTVEAPLLFNAAPHFRGPVALDIRVEERRCVA